jgi:hypothetical protein
VKKLENKIVYYKEAMEHLYLIFWRENQRRVHCHAEKLELNWRVSIHWVPLLGTICG